MLFSFDAMGNVCAFFVVLAFDESFPNFILAGLCSIRRERLGAVDIPGQFYWNRDVRDRVQPDAIVDNLADLEPKL